MKVLPMILPSPLWHGWNLMTWSHCAAGQHRLQEAERTKQERTNAKLGHIIMWPRFLQRLAPPHLPLRHWIWLPKMSKRGVIPRLMSQVKLENWRGNMVVFFGERSWEWCSFFWMNYRNVVARVVSVFVWLWWTSMISLLATWMEEFLHIMQGAHCTNDGVYKYLLIFHALNWQAHTKCPMKVEVKTLQYKQGGFCCHFCQEFLKS